MTTEIQIQSILDVQVSGYRSCLNAAEPKDLSLLKFLTSDKYMDRVTELRSIEDKKLRDEKKLQLPAITPSGTFSYRELAGLVKHSGFLQFDIDFKDNQHIGNYQSLKEQLKHIPNIAYCGLSVSGMGYWGLIPIAYPERHLEHFFALYDAFKKLGINIDKSCKDVCRLRIYSYDREAYFNHNAKVLFIYAAKPQKATTRAKSGVAITGNDARSVEYCISQLEKEKIDLTPNYTEWFEIGCSLANSFKENGRDYFHNISQFHKDYSVDKTDKQYDECLKHEYAFKLGTFFYYCKQQGIIAPQDIEPDVVEVKSENLIYKGETRTGEMFGHLIIASLWDKKGKKYRVVVDKNSNYITVHEMIEPLSKFYEIEFKTGKIDDHNVLINVTDN